MKTINQFRTCVERLGGFARDERGFVHASQTVLLAVIMSLGVVAGLVSLRDVLVQEYADTGLALENLNQSYHYQIVIHDPNDPNNNQVICKSTYTDTVGALAPTTNVKDGTTGGASPGGMNASLLDPSGNAAYGIKFPGGGGEGVALMVPTPTGNQIAPTHEGAPLPTSSSGNNLKNNVNSTPPTPEN